MRVTIVSVWWIWALALESSLTYVTVPSAAARTGVFCGTIKSAPFLRMPSWDGDNIKADADTTISTTIITTAREAATAFPRTEPGISLFHAILFWLVSYGLIYVLIILLIASTASSIP